ncbi:SDR family oxidoreductase [Sphingomonas populi]|uniref:SDR family oxidoreductase n=1 Tax=Sphingomonas populi TaxID=2484750 RepID=A0A4Q6XGW2_9SPHN|nr:SDR family NAD(P)-dependent oxidoreductase [Sphingomonas populi]RZF59131.1 SDR family oxidoreductase [Sphingomonas populi]
MTEKIETALARQFGLEGRVALVTGAAGGIGKAIAHALADAGGAVIVVDRDESGARAVAEELSGNGHDAMHLMIDIGDEQSVRDGCTAAVGWKGAPWVLVNNAAIQNRSMILDTTAEFWDRTAAVNARGPFLMTREIGRAMIAAGAGGRIVNICSLGAVSPMVDGLAAYSASKGALRTLTMTTAYEWAEHGITANAIFPGGVVTPGAINASGPPIAGPALRGSLLGQCTPEDIAAAATFLASPAAGRVTNQALTVDGGYQLS